MAVVKLINQGVHKRNTGRCKCSVVEATSSPFYVKYIKEHYCLTSTNTEKGHAAGAVKKKKKKRSSRTEVWELKKKKKKKEEKKKIRKGKEQQKFWAEIQW